MENLLSLRQGRSALTCFVLAAVLLCPVLAKRADAAAFEKDDQVILMREEPLRLYQAVKANGRKGQVFTVAAYTPSDHRVYVLYKDATGRSAGLNVAEDAVFLLPGRGEASFRQGLNDLKAGRWADASRDLAAAAAANPNERIYTDVKSDADTLIQCLLTVQQAQAARDQASAVSRQKRHNAGMADRVNPLDPTDFSGKSRAADERTAAQQIEDKAEENLQTAMRNLEALLMALDAYVHQKVEAQDYDVALAFASVRQQLAAGQGRGSALGADEAGRFDAALALADARCAAATTDAAAGRLFTANKEIEEGLAAVPTHRGLKALRVQVDIRLTAVTEGVVPINAAVKQADYERALKMTTASLADCPDHPDLLKSKALLVQILAARDLALTSADADERAHEYSKALALYQAYGKQEAVARVLPLLAKQEEDNGNFIRAVELYSRAGMEGDAVRLKQNRQDQEDAYTRARIALAEAKYDDALAVYARYKDDAARRAALKAKAAHLMEGNHFEDAMQAYRDAGAAEEIQSLMAVVEERKQALARGRDMEAGARFDEALALYAKAAATAEVSRLARKLADAALARKDAETAVTYYEMAGDYARAGSVRQASNLTDDATLKKLDPQELYKRCLPATVTIRVREKRGVGIGSGFFVAKGGVILTNHHVVGDADVVEVVTSDYKRHTGRVLARSDTPDLALVRVDTVSNAYLPLADSEKVQTGASVYAIGTPAGGDDGQVLPGSFAQGMISNTNGTFLHNRVFQMTVLINHGNSGGPLLDERGCVVGVNTFGNNTLAVLESGVHVGSDIQGINFAIKINEARRMIAPYLTAAR